MNKPFRPIIVRSLSVKLTLSFLLVSLTGIALVAALVWGITYIEFNRFLTDRGLNAYTTSATNYYKDNKSWDGIENYLAEQGLAFSRQQQENNNGQNQIPNIEKPPPEPFVLVDSNGLVLVGSRPLHTGEQVTISNYQQNVPIKVDEKVVGYVLVTGRPPDLNPLEQRFLARTNQALILAAIIGSLIAVLLGLFLARTITHPIHELTLASRDMAKGRFNQKVTVRSKDELGELTKTFNQMSADLEHANQVRQQMTADIAHDLRTPLSVITGYLEGLKDGVIKPTPNRFNAMYDEALYLQRLVEDLRTLSLADAGELSLNRQPVQPGEIIEKLAAAFQLEASKNQIQLTTKVDEDLPALNLDPERIQQALSNLMSNAIRHTPEGGEILLQARRVDGCVHLEVIDSGEGISDDMLPHIFDRFYRGDSSRQEGGSGLGLAIAKSIVEIQGGSISATSQGAGAGSSFIIQMPCA
jgi:signal transduction histidine kinase